MAIVVFIVVSRFLSATNETNTSHLGGGPIADKENQSTHLVFVPIVFVTAVILALALLLSLIFRRHFQKTPTLRMDQIGANGRRDIRTEANTHTGSRPGRMSLARALAASKRLSMSPVNCHGRFSTGSTTTMSSEVTRMTEIEMTSSPPLMLDVNKALFPSNVAMTNA